MPKPTEWMLLDSGVGCLNMQRFEQEGVPKIAMGCMGTMRNPKRMRKSTVAKAPSFLATPLDQRLVPLRARTHACRTTQVDARLHPTDSREISQVGFEGRSPCHLCSRRKDLARLGCSTRSHTYYRTNRSRTSRAFRVITLRLPKGFTQTRPDSAILATW